MSNKPIVFIIDDEPNLIESMSDLLSDEFQVLSAGTGETGLKVLREKAVDIVLLDYKLPDVDGIEVLKEIRALYPALPVIMISGHGSKHVVLSAWDAKADCYLDKPVDIEILQQKMHQLLGSRNTDPILNLTPSGLSPHISKIIKLINEGPYNDLTVKDIAGSFSMNPNYLSTVFKRETGMRLNQYLVMHKIGRSKKLLMNEQLNIKEVGFQLGFTSSNMFYKAFKKVTSISPTKYRELSRKKAAD